MSRYLHTITLSIIILMLACEKPTFDNPFDPDTELNPDDWAPTNLTAEMLTDFQVILSWQKSESQIEGFKIERKDSTNGVFVEVGTSDTTSYTDTMLVTGSQYNYRVCAYSGENKSNYTDTLLVKYWLDCLNIWGGDALRDNCGTCDSDSTNDCESDCVGLWGGTAVVDDCDVCVGTNTPLTGTCDCYGTPNGEAVIDGCNNCVGGLAGSTACAEDCLGLTGGDAVYDNCYTCDNDDTNDCTQDCAGIWGGPAILNECGICGGNSSPNTGTCDCEGTPNGSAIIDNCGYCVGTGATECIQDCNGNWGGDATIDNCNVCSGGTTGLDACEQDCAGNWDGSAIIDNCGYCVGTGATECIQDCNGNWGGDLEEDICGTCGGGISNVDECACPEEGEERDCAGMCGGLSVKDECGVCEGNDNYVSGTCNDCGGIPNGDALEDGCGDCNCGINGNYNGTSNCLIQSDCEKDCAGTWDGSATTDNCGTCDSDSSNDCVQDACGVWGGDAISCPAMILVPSEYSTIQGAINAASNGDTIIVSAGTYYENINFNGKNIVVQGVNKTTTIIDGGQNGGVVTFTNGESSSAVLSGFTITHGSTGHPGGGGIFCEDSDGIGDGIISLNNIIITDNETTSSIGGGIRCLGSEMNLTNVIIKNNVSAEQGGGFVGGNGCNANFNNVSIHGNSANEGGGGLYFSVTNTSTNVSLTNVLIYNNHSNRKGGAFANHGHQSYTSTLTLTNVIIVNNTSSDDVGGIYGSSGGEVSITNGILWDNSTTNIFGDGIFNTTYSDFQGGWAGTGNIDSDPLFINPSNGNYTLQSNSPCIDAGNPSSEYNDIDGSRNDMGAYGGPSGN